MTSELTHPSDQPFLVGRYFAAGTAELLPVSREELSRSKKICREILATFDLKAGRYILVVSLLEEGAHFVPIEEAATSLGLLLANADASKFEGRRVEAIIRLFDVAAVIGVGSDLLDSIEELGFNLDTVFSGKLVWARPDAVKRLSALPDVRVLRWLDLGPTTAMECSRSAGAHFDHIDWIISEESGELRLTNRLPRILAFDNFPTGVTATLQHRPCSCGIVGPRIKVST